MLVGSINSYSRSEKGRVFHSWIEFISQGVESEQFLSHFISAEVYELMLTRVAEESPIFSAQLTSKSFHSSMMSLDFSWFIFTGDFQKFIVLFEL